MAQQPRQPDDARANPEAGLDPIRRTNLLVASGGACR
jgi:hypothetical protein